MTFLSVNEVRVDPLEDLHMRNHDKYVQNYTKERYA